MQRNPRELMGFEVKSWKTIWIFWAVISLVFGFWFQRDLTVRYYWQGLIGDEPLAEYPAPLVWFLRAVDLFSGGHFVATFSFVMAGITGIVLYFLWRANAKDAALFWVLSNFLLVPTVLPRLDLLPGLTVGIAAYLLLRGRTNIGVPILLAVATWFKIWPIFLTLALVELWRRRGTYIRALVFVISFIIITAVVIAVDGVERTLSPLSYQTDRGIQMESLWAMPFFLPRIFTLTHKWWPGYAESRSYEIFGPGVQAMSHVADVVFYLSILVLVAIAVYHFFTDKWTPVVATRYCAVIIMTLILTNKVLSPQYLTWLSPLLVAYLVIDPSDKYLRSICRWFMPVFILTTAVFPNMYQATVLTFMPFPLICLIARNILLIIIGVKTYRWWLASYKKA
ncbi:MAG: hypothetical protein Q3962_09355 [Corynebacterium sp.]|nr:hypothetical protein [Corynebacterium sp.]